jgi:hypothetical protein
MTATRRLTPRSLSMVVLLATPGAMATMAES